jgi:hypothetical protein
MFRDSKAACFKFPSTRGLLGHLVSSWGVGMCAVSFSKYRDEHFSGCRIILSFSHCKCFVEPRTFPGSPLILLIQGCFHVCVPSRAGTAPALVCQGCHDPGTQGLPQQTFLSSQPLRLAGQDPCLGSVVSSEASLGPADEVSCVLMVMAQCPHLFLL